LIGLPAVVFGPETLGRSLYAPTKETLEKSTGSFSDDRFDTADARIEQVH
jgi:hypothetical protein